MQRAMLTAMLLGSAGLRVVAAGISQESSLCVEVEQEVDVSLELLQHGKHNAGKSGHTGHSMEDALVATVERGAKQRARSKEIEGVIQQLASHVIATDAALRQAREEFAAKTIKQIKGSLHDRAAARLKGVQLLSSANLEKATDWQNAEIKFRNKAIEAVDSALKLPAVALTLEEMATSMQEAKKDDTAELVFNITQAAISAIPVGLPGKVVERAKMIADLAINTEAAWQKALDSVQKTFVERTAARKLLDIVKKQNMQSVPSTKILEQRLAGMDIVYQKASRAAKEKAMEKVFAEEALDTFEWMVNQTMQQPGQQPAAQSL